MIKEMIFENDLGGAPLVARPTQRRVRFEFEGKFMELTRAEWAAIHVLFFGDDE